MNTEVDAPVNGTAVEQIAALADRTKARVELVALPRLALPQGVAVGAPHVLVSYSGSGEVKIHDLLPHVAAMMGKPVRRSGVAVTTSLASFCDLVRRHAAKNSVIFLDANWRAPKLTAVLDYHLQSDVKFDSTFGDDDYARNGKHRVTYAFPLSDAWKAWIELNGKPMAQLEFATLIEDRIGEVAAPTEEEEFKWGTQFRTTFANPSDLIDLARGLEVRVGSTVKNRVRLDSGEVQLQFETENRTADGQPLIVPGLFMVSVPAFYLGDPLRIPARLRYRVKDGALVWFYDLYRPDLFVDERIRSDAETVRLDLGLPVYDGAPEAV
jgi:uncharacterized protein YfdQ (DUF2303 family)